MDLGTALWYLLGFIAVLAILYHMTVGNRAGEQHFLFVMGGLLFCLLIVVITQAMDNRNLVVEAAESHNLYIDGCSASADDVGIAEMFLLDYDIDFKGEDVYLTTRKTIYEELHTQAEK